MISIIPYSPLYEDGIKSLCKIPVSGRISFALEREPLYLTGAQIQCEEPEIYVAYDADMDKIWAVFNVGKRRLWINGEVKWVRYLCDLRIHPEKQGSTLLLRIIRFFKELSAGDEWPAQTIVFSDNISMLKMIERRSHWGKRSTLPYYHFAGKLITHLCSFESKTHLVPKYKVRRAFLSDIPEMQSFMDTENSKLNYSPYYDITALNSTYFAELNISDFFLAFENERIVGMCGIWDQSDFKQTRIAAYDWLLTFIRPIYNLVAGTGILSPLPKAGKILKYLNTHSIVIKNRNPAILSQLLFAINVDCSSKNFDY